MAFMGVTSAHQSHWVLKSFRNEWRFRETYTKSTTPITSLPFNASSTFSGPQFRNMGVEHPVFSQQSGKVAFTQLRTVHADGIFQHHNGHSISQSPVSPLFPSAPQEICVFGRVGLIPFCLARNLLLDWGAWKVKPISLWHPLVYRLLTQLSIVKSRAHLCCASGRCPSPSGGPTCCSGTSAAVSQSS